MQVSVLQAMTLSRAHTQVARRVETQNCAAELQVLLGTTASLDTLTAAAASDLAAGFARVLSLPAAAITATPLSTEQATAELEVASSLLAARPMQYQLGAVIADSLSVSAAASAAAARRLLSEPTLLEREDMPMPHETIVQATDGHGARAAGSPSNMAARTSAQQDQRLQPYAGDGSGRGSRRLLQSGIASLPVTLDSSAGAAILVAINPSEGSKSEQSAWDGALVTTAALLAAISSAIASEQEVASGVALASAASLHRQGVCGNHRCELGELVR
jgi:hypothetical protein